MNPVSLGYYLHKRTGNLYRIIGSGRSVHNPYQPVVIYEQLYKSKLKNTNITLLKGSMWTRPQKEFNQKFIQVKTPK